MLVSGVQQSESVTSFFFFLKILFPLGCYRVLSRVPCAIQQVLIILFFIYSSVFMLTLIFPRLSLPHPLIMINLFSTSMTVLIFYSSFVPPFFLIPHISDIIVICLSDFTQYDKQSLGPSLLLQMALFCSYG